MQTIEIAEKLRAFDAKNAAKNVHQPKAYNVYLWKDNKILNIKNADDVGSLFDILRKDYSIVEMHVRAIMPM